MSEPKGLDFEGLGRALLAQARLLIPAWLPGGSPRGHEYVCGDLRGGPGESFSVNLDTGRWADFAGDIKGGDLISLYAAIEGIGQGEAAKVLAERMNYALKPERQQKAARIEAPPAGAAKPDLHHFRFGAAAASWVYRDKEGRVLFYIARYNEAGGGKQFVPWCWDAAIKAWACKAWPKPRPIYGLDRLAAAPDKPVLVVEGEKTADAAAGIAADYVVVSWPGGSAAWATVDWSPLYGRHLLLWPDADRHVAEKQSEADKCGVKIGEVKPYHFQPGPAAMAGIAGLLNGKAASIKIIDVGIDPARADGWDAADAIAQGWGWEQVFEWASPRAAAVALVVDTLDPEALADELAGKSPTSLYAEWEKLGVAVSQSGAPIANFDNALRVIEGREEFKELLWYDEFHKRYLTRFNFNTWRNAAVREWTDVDELNLTAFMQRQLGLRRISDDMVHKAAVVYANQRVKNEPRDWLGTLTWDGRDRCEAFFTACLGARETDYARAASKNFWVGMVARVFEPGCQLDNMVVLEGAQGVGKTRALRAIGGPFYTEAKEAVTSKDFFMVLHGRLLVEIAELDAFNRAEVTRIKQVVTCATDRFRAPYARVAQDHPRMSVFVGTTNEKAYLRDHTGGRRFWPVRCGDIDIPKIKEQREQLFAEAVACYKKGQLWYTMPAAATAAEQEERRQSDEWEGLVAEYLVDKKEVTLHEIAQHLKVETAKLDMLVQKRIANVLRTLGWEKRNGRDAAGRPVRLWREEELPFKEKQIFDGRLALGEPRSERDGLDGH